LDLGKKKVRCSERSWAHKFYLRHYFISVNILFDEAFQYGVDAGFGGYVVTNPEPLCIEFCNLVQCVVFVKHLTS
jgi:hypothetical protein